MVHKRVYRVTSQSKPKRSAALLLNNNFKYLNKLWQSKALQVIKLISTNRPKKRQVVPDQATWTAWSKAAKKLYIQQLVKKKKFKKWIPPQIWATMTQNEKNKHKEIVRSLRSVKQLNKKPRKSSPPLRVIGAFLAAHPTSFKKFKRQFLNLKLSARERSAKLIKLSNGVYGLPRPIVVKQPKTVVRFTGYHVNWEHIGASKKKQLLDVFTKLRLESANNRAERNSIINLHQVKPTPFLKVGLLASQINLASEEPLSENLIPRLYALLSGGAIASTFSRTKLRVYRRTYVDIEATNKEKRGYLKHLTILRYRWLHNTKIRQLKLFKKFFRRSFKRYRKIGKNRLFVTKFRRYFPKLTGLSEKGLLHLWAPFRRSYGQHWGIQNAVSKFSQLLLLMPSNLLVLLGFAPSQAACKYLIKSGAIAINGLAATEYTQLKLGDLMQINICVWKSIKLLFNYQKWNYNLKILRQVSFLEIDWSSMMFGIARWPYSYELAAKSFLSERWVRYYIRLLPARIKKFKKPTSNWKVYKKLPKR